MTRNQLEEKISMMIIPETKKELSLENVSWMLRNLGIANGNNPDFPAVIKGIKKIWREENMR